MYIPHTTTTLATCNHWHCFAHNRQHSTRSRFSLLRHRACCRVPPSTNLLRHSDGGPRELAPVGDWIREEADTLDQLEDAIVRIARDFDARALDLASLADGSDGFGFYETRLVPHDGCGLAADNSILTLSAPAGSHIAITSNPGGILVWQGLARHLFLGLRELQRAAEHEAEDLRTLLSRVQQKRKATQP